MSDERLKTPLVSILIPLYNKRDQIGATLDSVFSQTFKDFEVIVVDDGSTDGSHRIVESYGDDIRFYQQANQGAGATRNRGIELSTGGLIAFHDADDE